MGIYNLLIEFREELKGSYFGRLPDIKTAISSFDYGVIANQGGIQQAELDRGPAANN